MTTRPIAPDDYPYAMGEQRAAVDCAPEDVRLLTHCIQSLMGVRR